MIKATEARAMVEEAIEREITLRREKAQKFCEELSKAIEDTAQTRNTILENVMVDRNIRAYVIAELQNNGYTVTIKEADTLSIAW
jgi:hypothetical protein